MEKGLNGERNKHVQEQTITDKYVNKQPRRSEAEEGTGRPADRQPAGGQ